MSATSALYALGASALAASVGRLTSRLDLSRAKHRSLAGHSRLARRIARLVPFYEYDEARFFSSDDAPAEIAARRRAGFFRLAALYADRFAETARRTAEVEDGISDLQFTGAYRVPFQYSRFVRRHLRAGALLQSSAGVTVTDLDGNRFYDLTGSYGVNVFGYDFYKDVHRPRDRARARARSGARRLSPGHRVQRRAAARDLRARRGVVPHVRHRGGHAGGAARALPHRGARTSCASAARTTAGGATCSRASATRCRRARPTRCGT